MAESSSPWIGGGAVDAGGWRAFGRQIGDGVTNDTTASTLLVTASGSDGTVSVAAGTAIVQGAVYRNSAALTLNVGATGTAPTGDASTGQWRYDWIVLRYDPSQAVANRVKATVKAGTPHASNPQLPALDHTYNPADGTGAWDHPIASIRRRGNVAITQGMINQERFVTAPTFLRGISTAMQNLPDGSVAFSRDKIEVRRLSGGILTWWDILDPDAWQNITLRSGVTADTGGTVPQWRVLHGQLQLRGAARKVSGTWSLGDLTSIGTIPGSVATDYGLTAIREYPIAFRGANSSGRGVGSLQVNFMASPINLSVNPVVGNPSIVDLSGVNINR